MTKDDLYHGLHVTLGHPAYPPMVDFIVAFVAEWLEDIHDRHWIDSSREQLPHYWREEMGG